MSAQLSVERQGEVALFRLGDDGDFPRLSLSLLGEIERALIEAGRDAKVRGIVIAGSDRAFAAGADLVEVSALTAASAFPFSAVGQGVLRSIERFPKPVVAAIRGYCLGGGLDLALACHMRIAATDAIFGHPGGTLGIMTGFGGTQRLPRLIGRARAMEMLAAGRTITAGEAHSWRLVSRVVAPDGLLDAALETARPPSEKRLASLPRAEAVCSLSPACCIPKLRDRAGCPTRRKQPYETCLYDLRWHHQVFQGQSP